MIEEGAFNIINNNLTILRLKRVIGGEYVKKWCELPYTKNSKGCPQCERCKHEKLWTIGSTPPYILLIRNFDIGEFARNMKSKFPDWTDKQCRNSRLWQSHQDKLLRDDVKAFRETLPYDTIVFERPEMNGVNLFSTLRVHGFLLRKNPVDRIHRISMIGKLKTDNLQEWFK